MEKIEQQENGKPILPGIHFNISHSGNQVICGFSQVGQLGVDLERITSVDYEDFTSMFSAQEWLDIRGAEDPLRSFYSFWTRKESIIKALGLKLSYLHKIDLDVACDHFVIDGRRWFLRDIDVGEGYSGALCSKEEITEVAVVEIKY